MKLYLQISKVDADQRKVFGYASTEALSHDLLSYLRGRPVKARGHSLRYRLGKYVQRHRWAIGAASLVLAVMVTALTVVGWQAQKALREAGRAQAMQSFVAGLFESAGSTPMEAPIDLRTLLDMGIVRGDLSLARQPQARAELYGDAFNDEVIVKPGWAGIRGLGGFDRSFVDGIAEGTATAVGALSSRFRMTQNGFVRSYALAVLSGSALVLLALLAVNFS